MNWTPSKDDTTETKAPDGDMVPKAGLPPTGSGAHFVRFCAIQVFCFLLGIFLLSRLI